MDLGALNFGMVTLGAAQDSAWNPDVRDCLADPRYRLDCVGTARHPDLGTGPMIAQGAQQSGRSRRPSG